MTGSNTRSRAWLRGVALGVALAAAAAPALGAQQPKELGIDTAGFDRGVRPQDDFYRYVAGGWMRTSQIPADRTSYGAFVTLFDRSEAAIHQILDEAVAARNPARGSDTQKLGDLYASFMDSARVESLGITPIQADLARIRAVTSASQYPALFAWAHQMGVPAPFSSGVQQDLKQSDRYAYYLGQSGLGLPDRDYYLRDHPRLQAAREAYVTYMETLLRLAGEPDPAGAARRVMAFETQLAQRQWDQVRSRDRDQIYNKKTIAELQQLAPRFAWAEYLRAGGINTTDAIVSAPSYIAGLDSVLAATPVADVKAYMLVRVLNDVAPYLSSPFSNASFQFRGRTLGGAQEQRPRWKRGVALVEGAMGQMLGKAYVERNFPPEHKAAMQRLVQNLLTAFGQGIDSLAWMSPATKAQAHDKLSHITVKIGYPDKWQDYSALQVTRNDLMGNLRAVARYRWNRQTGRLGRPVDRTEWGMTPQTVNAYYNPTNNEIVFPAAILQPPFFNPAADDAVNYGGIVAVIGHEVSHAFDDQGSKSDGAGNLRNWWTDADAAAFKQRTDALAAQYDAYTPLEGMHVNGRLTLGENIGDLSGLAVAYRAYRASLNGQEAPVIGGFTGDQRFFLGWAQVWRTLYREEALRNQILTNPHSPGEYRANGPLVNNEAFFRAFGVKEGDKMYRPADQRVVIW
ncbi:MAG TPA: M13 family metallopeptidase [Longimicrobium sp.]